MRVRKTHSLTAADLLPPVPPFVSKNPPGFHPNTLRYIPSTAAAHLPEQSICLLRNTEAANKGDHYECDEQGRTRLYRSPTPNEDCIVAVSGTGYNFVDGRYVFLCCSLPRSYLNRDW